MIMKKMFLFIFSDITVYDNALETESDVSLPNKLGKNGNMFLFFVVVISLIIVVIAVFLQLSQ